LEFNSGGESRRASYSESVAERRRTLVRLHVTDGRSNKIASRELERVDADQGAIGVIVYMPMLPSPELSRSQNRESARSNKLVN
jgi:hypothetical protein